jgi:hypothetical protein
MAKAVAKSASRALGLLIVKSKIHDGFQHNIFFWCVFTNSQEKSHSLVLDSINAREVSSSPNAGSIVYN